MKHIVYEKILIPYDGSKIASAVLPHLLALEGGFNAKVILLQVIDSIYQINYKIGPLPMYSGGFTMSELADQMAHLERKAAEKTLKDLEKNLQSYGIPHIEKIISEGNPSDEIIRLAKKEKVDLILMSTHGRSGIGRFLIGSVADQVVHHAPCPVLLIHPLTKSS